MITPTLQQERFSKYMIKLLEYRIMEELDPNMVHEMTGEHLTSVIVSFDDSNPEKYLDVFFFIDFEDETHGDNITEEKITERTVHLSYDTHKCNFWIDKELLVKTIESIRL